MQGDIRNRVLDDNAGARFAHRDFAPRAAVDLFRAEILFRDFVTPIAESAFGELHDVALVHQGHAFALVLDRVTDRAVDQPNAARAANRFDADAHHHVVLLRRADAFPEVRRLLFRAEPDLVELLRKFLLEKSRTFAASGVPALYSMPA